MGILKGLFNWFSAKDANGHEMKLGYVLEGEPKTQEDVQKLFKAFGLSKYYEPIKPLLRPGIALSLTSAKDNDFELVESKIGGKPTLKSKEEWPKNDNGESLSFIGQINLEDVAKEDVSKLLPTNGLLSFFFSTSEEDWGNDPKDRHQFLVLFTEDFSNLEQKDFPENLEETSIFPSSKIKFEASLSIPSSEYEVVEGLIDADDFRNYYEVSRGNNHQMLGYPGMVQGTMELECELVTHGLFVNGGKGYENPGMKELEKGKEDWVLLLQINPDDDKTSILWGDSGRIYFWIKKHDLLNKDFSQVWCILQIH